MGIVKSILILAALILTAGCGTVPSTKLSLNPQTGKVDLDSPKEISINSLVATLPNGTTVNLQGYQSHNSPEVLATVANANAMMADRLLQAMQMLKDMAAQGATKAVVPVP